MAVSFSRPSISGRDDATASLTSRLLPPARIRSRRAEARRQEPWGRHAARRAAVIDNDAAQVGMIDGAFVPTQPLIMSCHLDPSMVDPQHAAAHHHLDLRADQAPGNAVMVGVDVDVY